MAFEVAERETDDARRRAWMTFVIVGAGPTGVELAGTLAEVTRQTLARDFRHINTASARVILVEASPRVLARTPKISQRRPASSLRSSASRFGPASRSPGSTPKGYRSATSGFMLIRSSGPRAWPLRRWPRTLGVPLDRAGRVMVEPELTIPGHDDVYVIGDLAHVEHDGALVPGVAPAAMQEGWHAAQNIMRTLRGQPRDAVSLRRQGDAGHDRPRGRRRQGRADQGVGLFAWLLWLFVHILFLIGFRNRLLVMIQWAWLYVTFDRGARLITEPLKEPLITADSELRIQAKSASL